MAARDISSATISTASNSEAQIEDNKESLLFSQSAAAGGRNVSKKSSGNGKENPKVQIFVKTPSGKTLLFEICLYDTIKDLKQLIQNKAHISPLEQRLVFTGKQLKDEISLKSYSIRTDITLHLLLRLNGGRKDLLCLEGSFWDQEFDRDFTGSSNNGRIYLRGGEEYKPPYGWRRYGLNVKSKYGDNAWLGSSGLAAQFSGEWPVSYHGTSKENVESIATTGYRLSKGLRFQYGRGIYTSPDIKVAKMYASRFCSEGKVYRFVLQNRVNPDTLRKIEMLSGKRRNKVWISKDEWGIRPYGILVREINGF